MIKQISVTCEKCKENFIFTSESSFANKVLDEGHYICFTCEDELSVEKLQEIRVEELKDFNSKILQAELKNQELQKELYSCIQTLIEASAAATITQDIVVGNLVDRKLADLAKTHKIAVDHIEKVTGKSIDVVLAENAALEALEGEDND